jgi:hypothetical protein
MNNFDIIIKAIKWIANKNNLKVICQVLGDTLLEEKFLSVIFINDEGKTVERIMSEGLSNSICYSQLSLNNFVINFNNQLIEDFQ